jgi:hypothetical protein
MTRPPRRPKATKAEQSPRMRAYASLGWMFGSLDDRQIERLLQMTLRDWVDWIESGRAYSLRAGRSDKIIKKFSRKSSLLHPPRSGKARGR